MNIWTSVLIAIAFVLMYSTPFASAGAACSSSELSVTSDIGDTFCIPYSLTGADIVGTKLDTGAKSLIINVAGESDGQMELTIPRSVLDAKSRGEDVGFLVLINGEEFRFVDEEATDTDRILTIGFPAGAEEIEIGGTFVVPEFDAIAVSVFALAILTTVAFSRRTLTRFVH